MSIRGAWIHPLIKTFVLFGFAVYIAYLVKSDHILFYISPRMVLYVKLSALAMYAAGAYQLFSAVKALTGKRESCDCGHDHNHNGSLWRSALVYGLFALPLLLGFFMPDTTLGSTLAAKKGMNLNSSASIKTAAPPAAADSFRQPTNDSAPSPSSPAAALSEAQLKKLFPSDPFTEPFAKLARKLYNMDVIPVSEELFIETITTLDLYAAQFTGKQMKLSGFVYRDDTMNARQFVVARFSIQCCSADGAPFGVLVDSDRANVYREDEWVEITGTIAKTKLAGDDLMVIKAEHIAKIPPPKQQYVYPNDDFGA